MIIKKDPAYSWLMRAKYVFLDVAEKRSDTLCKKEKLTRYHTMLLNWWCDKTKSIKEIRVWRILVKLGAQIAFNK